MWVYILGLRPLDILGGFHEDCEKEEGECVSLKGASVDRERDNVFVDGHVVCV